MQLTARDRLQVAARWIGPSILAVAVTLGALALVRHLEHAAQDDAALHQIIGLIQSGRIHVDK